MTTTPPDFSAFPDSSILIGQRLVMKRDDEVYDLGRVLKVTTVHTEDTSGSMGETDTGATFTIGDYPTPAGDLIRELSHFVPIPAEARKVITAWPATAPSVEQIAEALRKRDAVLGPDRRREVAEEIRALWSPAPGDAAEVHETPAELAARGRVLEAEVETLNLVITTAQATTDTAIAAVGRWEDKVERYQAALEAAEGALHATSEAYSAQGRALTYAADHEALRVKAVEARNVARAARAAVEADTTEEAGA